MVNCLWEPIKSSFYESDENVGVAYSDLMTSSKETLDSILELQEVRFLPGNLYKMNESELFFYLVSYLFLVDKAKGLLLLLLLLLLFHV